MIVCLASPRLIYLLIAYPLGIIRRNCCLASRIATKSQYEMNLLFIGPKFDMAGRTAQILNIIFTSYSYSGGIPLLNSTCLIYLIIVYFTDKFLVLRHYRTPSYPTQDLYMSAVKMLPLAVTLHCIFTIFIYGNSAIFPVTNTTNTPLTFIFGSAIASKIEKPSGILNFFLILSNSIQSMLMNFLGIIIILCIIRLARSSKTDKTFREIRDNLKKSGLDSYDIRENPNYALIINTMEDYVTLRDLEKLDDNLDKTSERNKAGMTISTENKPNDKYLLSNGDAILYD